MIKEDNLYIYIKNKNMLEKFKKMSCSELGSSSNIYRYNKDEILKVFDYKKSILELNKLEFIKGLLMQSFVMPNKSLFINEQYFGYKMNYINGDLLIESNKDINYNDILININTINEDIVKLSDNLVEIMDLNPLSIIYDYSNKKIKIVDPDEFTISKKISKEELFMYNKKYFTEIFFVCIADYFNKNNNKYYIDMLKDYILNNNSKLSLYEMFYNIKFYLENISDKKINTVNEFRKVLVKK